MNNLRPSLTLFGGTILFLNIVVGAGLLVLPGLVYQRVGAMGLAAWLLCALAALPLLLVFIVLGQAHPNAGGISHYALKAFGSLGRRIAAVLFIGAVVFGLPSIAMTGGYYAQAAWGVSPHLAALVLLTSACLLHALPGRQVEVALKLVGSTLIAVLVALLIIGALAPPSVQALPWQAPRTSSDLLLALSPFMMIFFAFTGWEVASHAAEEFRNARRDFPLAMLLSFLAAVALYAAIAWLVQRAAPTTDFEAAFIGLTEPVLGVYAPRCVAAVALLLILANLFGAIWGVSRLVFSLARDGVIPRALASTRNGTPLRAVLATLTALLLVLALDWSDWLSVQQMLALAGQNFLLLYGVAAAALFVLDTRWRMRALALVALAITTAVLVVAGVHIGYPAALIAMALLLQYSARIGRQDT
ncbi:MAG: APC family permease [Rubrivivax sp.]|nr:MAG: APC family permease [Rubrivivax sp.]